MSFRLKMDASARSAESNIILALDLPPDRPHQLLQRSLRIFELASPHICAVKINRQLLLPLGLFKGVDEIVKLAHQHDLPAIMDCKINDVGHTNRSIAESYYHAGFDAVIANPFVGWEGGLQPVFDAARELKRGVILLVYMSHKGAFEGYGQTVLDAETKTLKRQYLVFARKAVSWNADGAVVGATYTEKIAELHGILGDEVPIYSPGVGTQGGSVNSAIKAGARFLIVGRSITLAKDPSEAARHVQEEANRCLTRLRS